MSSVRQLWDLLTRQQRWAGVVLLGLIMVGMALETLGVGLVVPMLALVTERDFTARYHVLVPVLRFLGNPSQEKFVVIAMLFLVGVYVVKTFYIAFMTWRQYSFLATVQVDLSQRLFAGYLGQPYAFHLRRNSAELIRNVISEVAMVVTGFTSVLVILAEALMVGGICALLLTVAPVGALLIVALFGGAGWAFHRVTRRHIARWGRARLVHDVLRTQHVMQGLGGIKEVKLLGREDSFLAVFRTQNAGRARVEGRQLTLQAMPRLLLELLVIAGTVALIVVTISQGRALQSLVPTIGLFGVAAFRLLPSANRILSSVQSVRFVAPGIRVIHEESRLIEAGIVPRRGQPMPFANAVTLERVTFQYESTAGPALSDVTLSIVHGTSVGFIGSSGAGKSTLVDIILGLLVPTSGTVRVDGVDIQTNPRGWQDQIGYVPQSIFLTDDTLRRNVAFGVPDDKLDEAAVRKAIHAAQLDEFVRELPQGLDTMVGERGVRISGGQRQRIGIARALYHDPTVLVLDEATSSLDTAMEHDVMETVRTLHGTKTLIIVAHRLNTVEQCDRLFRLKRGRIAEEGATADLLRRATAPTG